MTANYAMKIHDKNYKHYIIFISVKFNIFAKRLVRVRVEYSVKIELIEFFFGQTKLIEICH